jgi:tetratricopeptide (TPR) repeat protein
MDGVLPAELGSFKKTVGGWIEGRLLGLEVTICDYRHLCEITLPSESFIDVDIDYFVAMPADEAWINPREVFEALRQLPLSPSLVTISRSVQSGFTPLRYRFFADYLAALWEERDRQSDHYDRLFQLERRLRLGESILAACRKEAESHPDCAATWHLLGLAEADAAKAADWHSRAARLTPVYEPNLLRSICEIRSRCLRVNLADVMMMRKQAAAYLDERQRWLAEVEFGLIYSAFGQLELATECYNRASAIGGEHPELALGIARLLQARGGRTAAIRLLRVALEDDKSRTAARLMLAQIEAANGLLEEARRHLDVAVQSAPVWGQILELSAFVHHRLGNDDQARELQERADRLRRQNELLAESLG